MSHFLPPVEKPEFNENETTEKFWNSLGMYLVDFRNTKPLILQYFKLNLFLVV